MGDVKGSAVVLIAAVAMMTFLAGCETTKHAQTMSAEELAELEQASGQGESAEQGGVPLTGQSLGEESLSAGDASRAGLGNVPPSNFAPEPPPSPNLRGAISADKEAAGSGFTDGTMDSGSSGYAGEQFARALTPFEESLGDATKRLGGSMSGDEVVRLPDHSGAEEFIKPLGKTDVREGRLNQVGQVGTELDHVYFDFDQFVIRGDAVSILQANARLLNTKYQNSGVLVEGHCDERGTSEYNLVLGERRAKAVKDYLVDLGVSEAKIQIVSYGKERPSCTESKVSCWQQNRRGHFVLQ